MQCSCGGETSMRKKRALNGTDTVWQCSCGRIVGKVSARELREIDSDELMRLPWAVQKRKRVPNSRKREYQKALHSKHWKDLRERVLERDGGICQLKLWGCTGRATTVDHETYERLGNERDEDCRAACEACQQREREQRIKAHVLG